MKEKAKLFENLETLMEEIKNCEFYREYMSAVSAGQYDKIYRSRPPVLLTPEQYAEICERLSIPRTAQEKGYIIACIDAMSVKKFDLIERLKKLSAAATNFAEFLQDEINDAVKLTDNFS